jgi:transglutaminase/protease-like cytokinesis protein 3
MKKVLLTFVIWICLSSTAFANVPVDKINDVYENHLSEIKFSSTDIYSTKKDIRSMIDNNYEITYLRWYHKGSNWKVNVNWRQSTRLLNDDKMECSTKDYEVKQKAQEVLDEIITKDMCEYQKVYEIYNWIQNRTEYDYESAKQKRYRNEARYCDNMTGVLYNGKAVCTGYADAFYYMVNCSGVECRLVTNETHCWNMVKLRDKWYYIDVTDESGRCFLRGMDWAIKNDYVATSYLPAEIEKLDYDF